MQPSTRSRTLVVAAAVTSAATAGMAVATSGGAAIRASAALTGARHKPAAYRTARTVSHPAPLPDNEVGGPLLASRGIVVHYPPLGARRLPRIPASAYVIADASSGTVLAAKDAHGLFPPASTLKVLTAITMLPRLSPDATVVATKRAAAVEPNIVGLVPGHRYKVSDLFHALLLISANDAAVALAQASGSFSKGMALLNAEAHHLQAYDVVARQPNGLPAPGQVVSAYDLALIARQALAMPAFMKYDSTRTARFPVKRHDKVLLVNQNYLLTKYRGGLGGKIGWTLKAGATYIGLARRHGVTLIVTILHATPLTEITSAERLLTWGFAMSGSVRPVGVLVPPLVTARTAARPKSGGSAAVGSSLAGASGRSARKSITLDAGVAAGLCAAVLGGLAWLRRRMLNSRHPVS
ncbi:MAG TPA: D-alanyl-D-alanine carboxypeptidase [Streptosporangiaceae bacterium]|nr:D-alanyl-D-alanine carboxypeptidase [Streptosporangiaceae bacterium]